jgi:hypothetical protein
MSPTDGSYPVDVQSKLYVTLSGPVDPASVNRAHLVLSSLGVPVASRLSYDDTQHVITVDPMGLLHGETYVLDVSGLRDSDGHEVPAASTSFRTWVNPLAQFSETGSVAEQEGVAFIDVHDQFDALGRAARSRLFSQDHVLLNYTLTNYTADGRRLDVDYSNAGDIFGYTVQMLRADGRPLDSVPYQAAGPDGQWFTADDIEASYGFEERWTYTSSGVLATYLYHGLGGCCNDFFQRYRYNDDGTVAALDTYDQAGPDGVWGTDDDVLGDTEAYAYDDLGRITHSSDYSRGDVDSAPNVQAEYAYGANDRVSTITMTAVGLNPSIQTFHYDASGNVIRLDTTNTEQFGGVPEVVTTYDDFDNRIRKSAGVPGDITIWTYDRTR